MSAWGERRIMRSEVTSRVRGCARAVVRADAVQVGDQSGSTHTGDTARAGRRETEVRLRARAKGWAWFLSSSGGVWDGKV
jgi:hypothetical protein